MEIATAVWDFFKTDAGTGVLAGLLVMSEGLASIKAISSNSIFQLFVSLLTRLVKKPVM